MGEGRRAGPAALLTPARLTLSRSTCPLRPGASGVIPMVRCSETQPESHFQIKTCEHLCTHTHTHSRHIQTLTLFGLETIGKLTIRRSDRR